MDFLLIMVLAALAAWLHSQFKALRVSHDHLEARLERLERRWPPESEVPERPAGGPPSVRAKSTVEVPASASLAVTSPDVTMARNTSEPAPTFDAGMDEDSGKRAGFDFEDLFGRRLPIWAGGITLAVGGIFLVRLAIESGLMTPPVRVAASFVFGLLLLCAAETAFRLETRLADPRVRQALAGAGLATLYAAFYLAGSVYGLIGPVAAFTGLALVSALALALAFRFGLPTALLGLVGGFATPAMVSTDDPNLPLLSFYLALLAVGIAFTGRRMGAAWLGLIAIVAGFGWGALILSAVPGATQDISASGLYLIVLGVAVPTMALRRSGAIAWAYPAAAALASIQLAVLLVLDDFGLLAWGLYLLFLATLAVLGWGESAIRRGGVFASAVAAFMLAWWDASGSAFALVAGVLALLTAGVPIALAWFGRAREEDPWQAILLPPAVAAIAVAQFHTAQVVQPLLALGVLALGALTAGAAFVSLRNAPAERRAWGHGAALALMVYLALLALVPVSAMGWALAAIAAGTLLALPRRYHTAIALLGIAVAWAYPVLASWLEALVPAMAGIAAPASALPELAQIASRILPTALLAALACWRTDHADRGVRIVTGVLALTLGVVALHVAYRQLFPLADAQSFIANGVAERTVWQALLLGSGVAGLTVGRKRAAEWAVWGGRALVVASLAHFVWFSFLLHNPLAPLWIAQAVGSWPILNLLLPSYAIGAVAAWLTAREAARMGFPGTALAGDVALMVLTLALALSTLRHVFAGSVPSGPPMGQTEDLLRSLVGIVVALVFLAWGWWRGERRWRVGSLVLMLGAVAKVFVVDTAELEGALRVASFLALGFSLIGIGWVYARLLRSDSEAALPA